MFRIWDWIDTSSADPRLVGDDELGVHGERAGDADALALSAGEFVRIAAVILFTQSDPRQQLPHPKLERVAPGKAVMVTPSATISPTRMRGLSDA